MLGVKTVSEIYVGVGGSAKKVWPSYTDYGGSSVTLNGNLDICSAAVPRLQDTASSSGTLRTGSSIWGYTNSGDGTRSVCRSDMSTSSSFRASSNIHWYSLGPMDCRGYNYITMGFSLGNYNNTRATYYGIVVFGYNDTARDNPYYGGHYVMSSCFNFGSATSSSGYDTDYLYFLFDFTNITLESTYLQFGVQLGVSSDTFAYYSCMHASNYPHMYQNKPSDSVSATLTLS